MAYKVLLTHEAKENISAIVSYIAQDSPDNARRWRSKIRERLRSLKEWPTRHQIAYSAHDVGYDVRHTFQGVYRILYAVTDDCVTILSVRHGARQPLTPDEVRRLGA